MFKFLIPDKTHRKAVVLAAVVPEQVTAIVIQGAEPSVIRTELSRTPKDCIETRIDERTIEVTVTLREGIKAAAVV